MTTTALASSTASGLADIAKASAGLEYFGTAVDYPGTGEGSDPIYLEVANNYHEFDRKLSLSRWQKYPEVLGC
jgi:hypothetical protein